MLFLCGSNLFFLPLVSGNFSYYSLLCSSKSIRYFSFCGFYYSLKANVTYITLSNRKLFKQSFINNIEEIKQ